MAVMWAVGLAAVFTSHYTDAYRALNLDEAGLVSLYVCVGIGVPLLAADCHWREKSDGKHGAFGALFDALAGWC